ncbi:MAG: hypothetical protein LBV00_02665 [Propionibacteriaceae bacterium]|jgi:signal transduction histidine kinase|nr:hypothetical protein [Propionibacteriaceae bacterium]
MESTTNAVRHGFATEVTACCRYDDSDWTLTVQDNGSPLKADFSEGGGIRGMREKLATAQGTLILPRGLAIHTDGAPAM